MVGAGQLARMTQQAAIALGVTLIVLADGEDDPAVLAGARPYLGTAGALEDLRAIAPLDRSYAVCGQHPAQVLSGVAPTEYHQRT